MLYTFEYNGKFYCNFSDEDFEKMLADGIITTVEILEIKNNIKLKEKLAYEKRSGLMYEPKNVLVSLTSKDALAMLQVKSAFELGITNTVIKFSNGTNLLVNEEDFKHLAKWFAINRNKYFEIKSWVEVLKNHNLIIQ